MKPRSVTSQVMWSAVDDVGAGDDVDDLEAGRAARRAPGSSTTAAAASLNSAWETICCRSSGVGRPLRAVSVAGWTCRLVSSRHSITAGRCRAATKSAVAPSPGSAA